MELFSELMWQAGISEKDCMKLLKCSRNTIRNYKANFKQVPESVRLLLKVKAGDLSVYDEKFAGWKISQSELITPNDYFSIDRLTYIEGVFAENRVLKENRLKAEVFLKKG
jgi:hypothetical protein